MDQLTPEQRKELDELKAALQAEYAQSEASKTSQAAKKDIEELKPDFLASLQHIVNHSTNEGLKAKVAMWGYEILLEQDKAEADPLKRLIEGMPAPKESNETPA